MSLENPKGIESSVSKNTKQRRTFLKRASAGAVIASIPGRSAWAGIAGSIVASGHGSDFNNGACTTLLNASGFNKKDPTLFSSVFGHKPYNKGTGTIGKGTDYTFGAILAAGPGTDKSGFSDINLGLVLIYLNAINHDGVSIIYPVLEQHVGGDSAFAKYLSDEAKMNPGAVGALLMDTVDKYSNGGGCI